MICDYFDTMPVPHIAARDGIGVRVLKRRGGQVQPFVLREAPGSFSNVRTHEEIVMSKPVREA